MARFRTSPATEMLLAAIDGIEDDDVDWPASDTGALADWPAAQHVGTVRVLDTGYYLNIEDAAVLVRLGKHPLVRAAVARLDDAAHLDVAFMRLGGLRLGRPISQAVGTAVREWLPDDLGISYFSRLATNEPCWATWSTTRVDVSREPLSPDNPLHRAAVRNVAASFEIELPDIWA